jgi:hypothetical protein
MKMKNIYVKNSEFLELLREYDKTKSRVVYNKLGVIFQLIAKNFLNNPKFINYTEDRKDEMESDAVYSMIKYLHNYDLTKTNPFAYFTMIAYNSFLQNIKKYKVKEKMFVSLDLTQNLDYLNLDAVVGE